MYAFETVAVQAQSNHRQRQARISNNIRRVVDLMVHSGQRRAEAAKTVGITDEAVRQALLKPNVLAYLNTQKHLIRTSAMARTMHVVEGLLDAESESVRLNAVQYLEPAISKSEISHTHQGHIQGLTIVYAASAHPGDGATLIEHAPMNVERAKLIKSLPPTVQHPGRALTDMQSGGGPGNTSGNAENSITGSHLGHIKTPGGPSSSPRGKRTPRGGK